MCFRALTFIFISLLFACKGSQQKSEATIATNEIEWKLLQGTWYMHPDDTKGKLFYKDRSSIPPSRFIKKWQFDTEERIVNISTPGPTDRPKTIEYSWQMEGTDQLQIKGFSSFQIVFISQDSLKLQ